MSLLKRAELQTRDQEMRRLYESGMSTIEVGSAISLHHSQVSRRLRAMGVQMRPQVRGRVDVPTYSGAHMRVRADRGPAADYLCGCGSVAAQWAYRHDDPDELKAAEGAYSADPYRYDPMCVSCHKKFDLELIRSAS